MDAALVSIIQRYIQDFIHSFESAYDSSHAEIEGTQIFYYGPEFAASPYEVVPYQSIVFAIDQSPQEIERIIRSCSFPGDGSFAIQAFHESADAGIAKLRYQPFGYEYYLPNLLQIIDLPARVDCPEMEIERAANPAQADFINASFADFKPFPQKLLGAESCSAFYASIDGKAAGWGYLVHADAEYAYVAGMFTAPAFRQRGVASALLNRMHQFASEKGIRKVMLVPSFMAWNFYSRRGYRTIAHFSTFLPSEA